MNNKRTWIILGCTSMIGRCFAREVAQKGHDIILLGKVGEDLSLIEQDIQARYSEVVISTFEIDTGNLDSFSKVVEKCETESKNIISVFSALETVYTQKECGKDLGKIKNMFQINYFSQVYFLSAIAPVLQKQNCGEIVVLGSTAGDFGMPDNYAYGSTKAALHVWLQGFQEQMSKNNVTVTLIKADDSETVVCRESAIFQKPIDFVQYAKVCLDYAQSGFKSRYFPWHTAITIHFRRYLPFLNKLLKK